MATEKTLVSGTEAERLFCSASLVCYGLLGLMEARGEKNPVLGEQLRVFFVQAVEVLDIAGRLRFGAGVQVQQPSVPHPARLEPIDGAGSPRTRARPAVPR